VNDSLLATGFNDWLDAYSLDSVVVDSVTASGYEAYLSNVTSLHATRSRIAVTQSGRVSTSSRSRTADRSWRTA